MPATELIKTTVPLAAIRRGENLWVVSRRPKTLTSNIFRETLTSTSSNGKGHPEVLSLVSYSRFEMATAVCCKVCLPSPELLTKISNDPPVCLVISAAASSMDLEEVTSRVSTSMPICWRCSTFSILRAVAKTRQPLWRNSLAMASPMPPLLAPITNAVLRTMMKNTFERKKRAHRKSYVQVIIIRSLSNPTYNFGKVLMSEQGCWE